MKVRKQQRRKVGNMWGNLGHPMLHRRKVMLFVIDRVHAVTIKAPVTIEGIEINAVVDTGAEVTVMSERRFQEIPVTRRPELRQAPRS
jgi:hypothetical protein